MPPQNWQQVTDLHLDKDWTDEVQGVAHDGENWIFSCNANQSKPGHKDKSIYVFEGGKPLLNNNWKSRIVYYRDVGYPIAGTTENDSHWGQLTYYNGFIYVSHFWENGARKGQGNVVVFEDKGGYLEFHKWIELGMVTPSDGGAPFFPEFQSINPWDGYFYTCRGGPNTREFYAHDPETGEWKQDKVLKFSGGEQKAIIVTTTPDGWGYEDVIVDLPSVVQGACFSPNGHLYIACDVRLT